MRTGSKLLLLVLCVAATLPTHLEAQNRDHSHYASAWKTPWTYRGPRGASHWSALDPAYAACNTGKQQSPIDISNAREEHLPPLAFEPKSEPIRYVINNRYTIRVNYHDAPGQGGRLLIGSKRYQLIQFHWHHPSEHHLNGRRYPMELHLMYKAQDGEIAGVAVLLKAGKADPTVQRVFDHMPTTEGQVPAPGIELDPTAMVPHDTSYYTYMGSVSAPPCTEGVRWIILKTPGEVSTAQIAAFARLFPDDARPLQPLDGRTVDESR